MKKLVVTLFAALCLAAVPAAAYLAPTYYAGQASSHPGYVEAYVPAPIQVFWLSVGATWGTAPGSKVSEQIVLIPNKVWSKHASDLKLRQLHYVYDAPGTAPKDKYTVDSPDGKTTYTVPKGTPAKVFLHAQ